MSGVHPSKKPLSVMLESESKRISSASPLLLKRSCANASVSYRPDRPQASCSGGASWCSGGAAAERRKSSVGGERSEVELGLWRDVVGGCGREESGSDRRSSHLWGLFRKDRCASRVSSQLETYRVRFVERLGTGVELSEPLGGLMRNEVESGACAHRACSATFSTNVA